LIADDHALVRDGLRMLLIDALDTGDSKVMRVFEAETVSALLAIARAEAPDLLVTDLMMPGANQGDFLAEVARNFPEMAIIVISAMSSPDVVRRALAIENVFAFVSKSATTLEMRAAVASAMRREKLPLCSAQAETPEVPLDMSPRLSKLRTLVRQGMTNKMIAGELGISEGTVKNYMSDLFKHLRVSNRTQAARFQSDGDL